MVFDVDKFWAGYRKAFGKVTQKQVDAIEFLLASFDLPQWKDVRHIAYALATIKHETAGTFRPIKEYRNSPGSKGRKNQDRYWLTGYYGRGFVQLTWKDNYKKAAKATGFDLVNKPDLAMDPHVAFQIMTWGMHTGAFTGKKLSDFIKGRSTDYRNARTIINRLDKAALIAGYAKLFEDILKDSVAASSIDIPTAPSNPPEHLASTVLHEENANPTPTVSTPQPSISETTQVATTQGDSVVTEQTTVSTPKGDAPDVEPTQVTKNGPLSQWLFTGGGLSAFGTMIFGFVQTNLNAVAVGIICLTLLIFVIIFRKALTDAIRMQTAADPDKKNVT